MSAQPAFPHTPAQLPPSLTQNRSMVTTTASIWSGTPLQTKCNVMMMMKRQEGRVGC